MQVRGDVLIEAEVGKMWGYEPRYVGSLWKLKRERKQSH
jgi:hypothetical protein